MRFQHYYYLILCISMFLSCQNQLDLKPDKVLAVPKSKKDFQAILDNTYVFASGPFSEVSSADNYYVNFNDWQSASLTERNLYIWEDDVFNAIERNDWSLTYKAVFYANVVLDYIPEKIYKNEEWKNIKGQALFFRSLAFYQLLQIFASPYDEKTSSSDLGIPLRLNSDMNRPSNRASVKKCYTQVIKDLKLAANLLPKQQMLKIRSTKQAAFALLARIYLSMSNYHNALLYADSTLGIESNLLNYNILGATKPNPVSRDIALNSDEVILFSELFPDDLILSPIGKVDTFLYSMYKDNDLRKAIFFRENEDESHSFRGGYSGSNFLFGGLATDETYLIKAECLARNGKPTEAMNCLNHLLQSRWKTDSFIPLIANSDKDALNKILRERRKELVFRGLRWTDLRRLNKEKDHQTTIIRILNGKRYILEPNDPRYVLPIPENVISITGMQQNVR